MVSTTHPLKIVGFLADINDEETPQAISIEKR